MSNQDTGSAATGADSSRGPNPTGGRIHCPEHRWARRAAAEIDCIPAGVDLFEGLYYLERDDVAEAFGCGDCEVKHLRFLLRWAKGRGMLNPGERPVVSLTKDRTRRLRRIALKKLHALEHKLAAVGAIHWKDSSNYRRFQTRNEQGEIEAYGVDLTPLVKLIPLLKETAARLQEENAERMAIERRVSDIRRHVRDELRRIRARPGPGGDALEALLDRVQKLPGRRVMEGLDMDRLRSLRIDAMEVRQDARAFIDASETGGGETVVEPGGTLDFSAETGSQGIPVGEATITNTRRESSTGVVAADSRLAPAAATPALSAAAPGPGRGNGSGGEASYRPEDIKGPDGAQVLEALSPRIARYLPPDREPSMTDFVEAAGRARRDLKISRALWGKACRRLSPGGASLALAHVAAKWDAGEIRKTPGAYFNGVFKCAIAGELNLGASLWGMVEAAAEGPGLSPSLPAFPTDPATSSEGGDTRWSRAPHWSALARPTTVSALPSLFPDEPSPRSSRVIAGMVVMRRFCSGLPEPERAGMMQIWRDLVHGGRRWPYLDEVQSRYAEIGRQAFSPGHPERSGSHDIPDDGDSAFFKTRNFERREP